MGKLYIPHSSANWLAGLKLEDRAVFFRRTGLSYKNYERAPGGALFIRDLKPLQFYKQEMNYDSIVSLRG